MLATTTRLEAVSIAPLALGGTSSRCNAGLGIQARYELSVSSRPYFSSSAYCVAGVRNQLLVKVLFNNCSVLHHQM